jgi:serine/threonine-protein kinase PpkA
MITLARALLPISPRGEGGTHRGSDGRVRGQLRPNCDRRRRACDERSLTPPLRRNGSPPLPAGARGFLVALVIALLLAVPAFAQQRTPLLIPGKQTLFQRVLVRPGAMLAKSPGAAGGTAVPAFTVFYVYGRKDNFVEVGKASAGQSDGWIAADRLIDWKQTLTLAFTNPAGRDRVAFFKEADTVRQLLRKADPGAEVDKLRGAALAGQPSPVIAVEPENFVDVSKHFYLLPILGAENVLSEQGYPMRLLDVVSLPAEPQRPPAAATDRMAALRNFKAGLVFVVDTTKSMDKYIDETRDVMKRIYNRIRDSAVRDNFRFGMIAFRNSTQATPRLEYTTQLVADLDLSKPPEAILPAVDKVKATNVSSHSFDEDSMAGVKLAVDKINWEPFGGRYVVLITDAGSIGGDDRYSSTHMGPPEIRQLAKLKDVAIFAVHLLTPEGRADHAKAKAQYTDLTQWGQAGSLYYPVPDGSIDAFGRVIDQLANSLLQQVSNTTGVPIGGVTGAAPAQPDPRIAQQAAAVGNAMRLAWLGRQEGTAAPDVIRGATVDRDWKHPETASLEVRVLLSKNQLSDLQDALKLILEQGLSNRLSPQNFFGQLKAAAAATSRDPRRLGDLQKLGAVVGEYLDDLPYKSQVMELTEQEWLAMGAAAQRELLNSVEAKIRLYTEFHNQPEMWVSFDGGKVPGDALYPVPLEALP